MADLIIDIAVGISVDKTFHYRAPEEMKERLALGSRVLVPFGGRRIFGTIIGFPGITAAANLKSIIEIIDNPLPPGLLVLARWMADYYLYPLGRTIEAVVPGAVARAKPRKKKYIRLLQQPCSPPRGAKQAALVKLLSETGERELGSLGEFSRSVMKALVEAGIVEFLEREDRSVPAQEAFSPSAPPSLMPAQAEAVRAINEAVSSGTFAAFLLHGVTGSGLTNIVVSSQGGWTWPSARGPRSLRPLKKSAF